MFRPLREIKKINNLRIQKRLSSKTLAPSHTMGVDYIQNPSLNKGLSFSLKERQSLGIHGLFPPRIRSQEVQLEMVKAYISRFENDLNKYLYLYSLFSRNHKLFFRFLAENIKMIMPIIYTPTVGTACLNYNILYTKSVGLYLTIKDRGHCLDVINNWPENNVQAICVTDGERILGLGDLGVCGCCIPIGKSILYTALGGVPPQNCMPVTLDCGTDNETFLNDNLYLGLKMRRVRGDEYYEFVDEFLKAVVKRFGQKTLVQFEDFATPNAFYFLDKYRDKYCVFNDDIQGTAGIVLAGMLTCKKVIGKGVSEHTFLFFGAGGASIGIARLLLKAMVSEGLSLEDARARIWMFDVDGLVVKDRVEMPENMKEFAKDFRKVTKLLEMCKEIKPSVLIGASAQPNVFSPEILREMARNNERPIVLALSNPTSKCECTAQDAYDHTEGRVIYASGSPPAEVTYGGNKYEPGQCNNAYIFPGLVLGVLTGKMYHVLDDFFLIAAQVVADNVTELDLKRGSIYPSLDDCLKISIKIATTLITNGFKQGLCNVYPEPEDKHEYVMKKVYNYDYEFSQPPIYKWEREEEYTITAKVEAKDVPDVNADQ